MNFISWIFLLLTVLAWGSTPVFEKYALKGVSPLDGLFVRSVGVFLVFLLFFIPSGRIRNVLAIPSKNLIFFVISGILAGFLGMYFYYQVLKINPSSKIVPLAATYPLVAAIMGILFLKEELSLPRIIGTILIILGVFLVK
jgi:transporter family protein